MGVSDGLKLLKTVKVNLCEELANVGDPNIVIVVDLPGLIHKACRNTLAVEQMCTNALYAPAIVDNVMNELNRLQTAAPKDITISFICVLDGRRYPAKRETHEERGKNNQSQKDKLKKFMEQNPKYLENKELKTRWVKLSQACSLPRPGDVTGLMQALKKKDNCVVVLQSPDEADHESVRLQKDGYAHLIYTIFN
jgi:5'-3' exonuclease